jgi:amidophosphoribosyltransferase
MSDFIGHHCGIALVRLKRPLSWYAERHGTPLWGLNKLYLLMEKQRNRGQDGAGIAAMKLEMPLGQPWMFRDRCLESNAIDTIFARQHRRYDELVSNGTVHPEFAATVKRHFEFGAECYLGHLRYGTSGNVSISSCHPYFRRSSWPARNLMLAGNFNITNVQELDKQLIELGQHPIFGTDTQALLETVGFHLDEEHERIYRDLRGKNLSGEEITKRINASFDLQSVLSAAARRWDGGYALVGLVGNGDCFVLRDPCGIRPAFWFENDEVVAVASERAPLMSIFNQTVDKVSEIAPGYALLINRKGVITHVPVVQQQEIRPCSFERIYFSRGNDPEIYQERKALGAALAERALQAVDNDLENTVFSFVPNTAEIAYYGMMARLRLHRREAVKQAILEASQAGKLDAALLDRLVLNNWPRAEKIAVKDVKLRTFISQERGRNELASHVYDVCYGTVGDKDTLVCVDDSIVRGTTLRRSILRILSRLKPKRIIILSTAPQIRYPDCYGIDMSELGKFIAFEAAVQLLKERGQEEILQEVYQLCVDQAARPGLVVQNFVRRIYDPFSVDEISAKIAELVYPKVDDWKGEVRVIFQSIEGLHAALGRHNGDWYFTGRYPTPGGYRVLNQAFINYYEKRDCRAY